MPPSAAAAGAATVTRTGRLLSRPQDTVQHNSPALFAARRTNFDDQPILNRSYPRTTAMPHSYAETLTCAASKEEHP